jgi:thiosulfate dehydrogenase [quinone] large subunit
MGTNSAQNFTDPHNGGGGILIHLQNGNFVAYYRACTHAGYPVNYDTNSQQLYCPLHGARFNSTNGQVVQGPASRPLPSIQITVNSDGTITV